MELKKARVSDLKNENNDIANIDVIPYHYQQEIIDTLSVERDVLGQNKNLVVTATGGFVIMIIGAKDIIKSRIT